MGIYAVCEVCKRRRAKCTQPLAHKRHTGWVADWQPSRKEKRIHETFGSGLDNPRDLAADQLAAWKTDYKRGNLRFTKQKSVFFGELADKYWIEHASIKEHNPAQSAIYMFNIVKQWIGIDRKVGPLTDEEIQEFQNDMRTLQRQQRSKGLKGSTINRYFNIIHSIFERGRAWGIIKINPIEFVDRLQEEKPTVRFLDQKSIDHLYDTVANLKNENGLPVQPERIQRLIDYMFIISHTGARPSSIEECSFDNGDVDLTQKVIWFTTYKGANGQKHRYPVPIDDELLPFIIRRAEVTGRKGLVFDCIGLRKLEELAVKQSKLNEGKPEDQWFTMYGLKHCYASHLLMSGVSSDVVGKLLGHKDGRMVEKHYGHFTMEHLRIAQSKVNLTAKVQLKVV